MLIDLSIVTLVSILYYLLCSFSRILNFIVGMLLILILCWAVGVNVTYEASVSEIEFAIVVFVINVWITIHSHHLTNHNVKSRLGRLHQHRSDHIYTVRNRLNNFRLKKINDRFKATSKVYMHSVQNQFSRLNDFVNQHSQFLTLNQLIESLKDIQPEIDDINYHLDLPMQINYPHGLRRLVHQYHQITSEYQTERSAIKQETVISKILNQGLKSSSNFTYQHVTLRFPYQRLIHDRVKRQIDLLTINSRGVFAFTLLDTNAEQLVVNSDDKVTTRQINSKRYHVKPAINLKKKLNVDFEALSYLIPNSVNVLPHVGIICTNPNTDVKLMDPKFKVIRPQRLNSLILNIKPVLTPGQVYQINRAFRNCFSHDKKYQWQVFGTNFKHTITDILWYQNQVRSLKRKLMK